MSSALCLHCDAAVTIKAALGLFCTSGLPQSSYSQLQSSIFVSNKA